MVVPLQNRFHPSQASDKFSYSGFQETSAILKTCFSQRIFTFKWDGGMDGRWMDGWTDWFYHAQKAPSTVQSDRPLKEDRPIGFHAITMETRTPSFPVRHCLRSVREAKPERTRSRETHKRTDREKFSVVQIRWGSKGYSSEWSKHRWIGFQSSFGIREFVSYHWRLTLLSSQSIFRPFSLLP